jgi:hypothetical protein
MTDTERENPTINNDRGAKYYIDPVLSSSTRDARKITITDHESRGKKTPLCF